MKPFILLLKIQLLGLFGINKTLHADPAKAKRTLALAALVVAAVVLFASAYSAGVAQGLVQIGLAEAVPLVAVLVGAIAGAVAAFLKTNGVLFGFKDYDLVMSLPVPTSSVVLSRIASLYAMSLLFGVLVMVPAFAVYASAAGVSAVGVACMALSIVLAPLLPLAAAVVDEIAQKNASAHGSSAPTNGAYAGGSKSSDSIPVAEPTATATAATSTST